MYNLVNTAREFASIGITPIPVKRNDKIPIIKWKSIEPYPPPPDKFLVEWFSKDVNIGVICGGIRNLVVIDFDSMAGYYKYLSDTNEQNRTLINTTYNVKTRRGIHSYFFSQDNNESVRKNTVYNVDIKTRGGIVIIPPSIHPSGSVYSVWKNTPEDIKTIESTIKFFEPEARLEKESYEVEDLPFSFFFNDYGDVSSEDIKRKISITSMVSRYTNKIFRKSPRFLLAKCFCHDDKNPSLSIDTLYNTAKCFSMSCNLGDKWHDVISIYAIMNNISYSESIKILKESA